ncbi:MAG: anti-sigma factor, partial [Ignavibacteria bacterium]
LYAAGALNAEEALEVEDIIKKYPEIKEEYNNIQNAIFLTTSSVLKSPSENVKTDLLNKLNALSETKIHSIDSVKHKHPNINTFKYLMAASIAFLLLSLIVNYFLFTKLNAANNQIAVLNDQKKVMVQDYDAVNRKLTQISQDINIISDRNFKMVSLKGLEKSPGSDVVTFWNPDSKKVFIKVENLPVPPSNKQYQLWALSNGKPIDAGMMDVDPSDKTLHPMKDIEDAQAFAVTLEPKGGSVNPTMTEMYVMGTI